jgi:AcrR family transcriptional regulator
MVVKNKSREETEQKLLNAGLEIFAKHGYDGATTRMVADAAEINESLINRYFDGKAGLLRAIILEFMNNLDQTTAHYPESETVEGELLTFIETCLAPCSNDINFVRLVISRMLVDAKLNAEVNMKLQHPAEILLSARLKKFQKNGLINKNCDLQNTFELLHYLIKGIMFENAVGTAEKVGKIEGKVKKIVKQMAKDLTN